MFNFILKISDEKTKAMVARNKYWKEAERSSNSGIYINIICCNNIIITIVTGPLVPYSPIFHTYAASDEKVVEGKGNKKNQSKKTQQKKMERPELDVPEKEATNNKTKNKTSQKKENQVAPKKSK